MFPEFYQLYVKIRFIRKKMVWDLTDVVALKGSQCKSFTYQSCHHRQYLGIAEDVIDTVRDRSLVEWNSINKRSVDGSSSVPTKTLHIKMN
jgi:hypothetical protein